MASITIDSLDGPEEYSQEGPVCPCCKHLWATDEGFYFDESGYELTCDDCHITFIVEAHVSWSFTTKVPPAELHKSNKLLRGENEALKENVKALKAIIKKLRDQTEQLAPDK